MVPRDLIAANVDAVFQTVALAFHISKSAEAEHEPEIAFVYDALASGLMLLLIDESGLTVEQITSMAEGAYTRMFASVK